MEALTNECIRVQLISSKYNVPESVLGVGNTVLYDCLLISISLNSLVLGHFFFFSFLVTLWHMEFLGQGSDLSHSYDPSRSCGNAGSLIHCAGPETEPVSQCSQDDANPVVPQWELR